MCPVVMMRNGHVGGGSRQQTAKIQTEKKNKSQLRKKKKNKAK
jgi:hypothetical protein